MKILVERGWGEIFANFTRQALLTKLDVWRPVAFAIGASSNIVTAGDNVIEDSVELASKLSSYHFDIQSDGNFYSFTKTVNILNINDLNTDKISVLNNDNAEILHTVSQEVTVSIYFRKASGTHLLDDNQAFLHREGISNDNIVVFNTRHTDIISVKIKVDNEDLHNDCINFEVQHYNSAITEEAILKDCFRKIVDVFGKFV